MSEHAHPAAMASDSQAFCVGGNGGLHDVRISVFHHDGVLGLQPSADGQYPRVLPLWTCTRAT